MKVEYFVDEMPRDCASCKHYHMNCADGYSCSKLRKEIHPNFSEGMGYRIKECPLQPLANYTKQVRKEVCEEIYNKCCKKMWVDDEGFDCVAIDDVVDILQQIQGETK